MRKKATNPDEFKAAEPRDRYTVDWISRERAKKVSRLPSDKAVHMACEDNLKFMRPLDDESMKLIVTSPPYNMRKKYEKRSSLDKYLENQAQVISECVRLLHPQGSLCWQVGNHVDKGEVHPLDIVLYPVFKQHGLKLRNRIIWHFGHGLHCSKRFSGRHEAILWFTKSDDYTFNLDPIRIPSKYPQKNTIRVPIAANFPVIRLARIRATCGKFLTSRIIT